MKQRPIIVADLYGSPGIFLTSKKENTTPSSLDDRTTEEILNEGEEFPDFKTYPLNTKSYHNRIYY